MNEQELAAAVQRYFDTMDAGDAEGTAQLFADDGVLECASTGMHLQGHEELRSFFQSLADNTNGMTHAPTNVVVDTEAGKASCELTYTNDRKARPFYETENCNFFDFGPDGRFTRVRFWMGTLP